MTSRIRWRAVASVGLTAIVLLVPLLTPTQISPQLASTAVHQAPIATGTRADGPHVGAWWYRSLRLGEAHQEATGEGVTIGVIDSGLNLDAPELRDADITMMRSPCLPGRRVAGRRSRSTSDHSALHGTRVVSMIVGNGHGSGGPGTGVMGAAPDAKILFWDNTEESYFEDDGAADTLAVTCGEGTLGRLIKRIVRRVDVVNLSYGGGEGVLDHEILPGVVRANQAVLVAAAQSTDSPTDDDSGYEMPASMPGVVSVAAYDRELKPWAKSDTRFASPTNQKKLHRGQPVFFPVVAAPGVEVPGPGTSDGTFQTAPASGTSYAAPLVSGTLALVKQKYPSATPNQLIQHLIHHTGTKQMDWYTGVGFGNVVPERLLANDPTRWPDENPLLDGPLMAIKNYPRGIDTAPPSPTAEPSQTTRANPDDPETRRTEASESDALPVWAWPAGGVAVAGLIAAGWWFSRDRDWRARRDSNPKPSDP